MSLLNLLQYCFCFIFWFFACETCGILASQAGIEPALLALEGKVLIIGLPEKSFHGTLLKKQFQTANFVLLILLMDLQRAHNT